MFDKRSFDPTNPADVAVYKKFLKTNSWGGLCPFELEWPWLTVPDMIANKIAHHYVNSFK